MALATQCPHCGTMFRVASDQLKLRGGIVRCGACQEIFDGSATLVDLDALPARAPVAARPSSAPAAAPAAPVSEPAVPAAPAAPAAAPPDSPPAPSAAPAAEAEPDPLPFTIVDGPAESSDAVSDDAAPDVDEQPVYTLDFDHTFDPFGILPKVGAADEPDPVASAQEAPAAAALPPLEAGEAGQPASDAAATGPATEPRAEAPAAEPAAAEAVTEAPADAAPTATEAASEEPVAATAHSDAATVPATAATPPAEAAEVAEPSSAGPAPAATTAASTPAVPMRAEGRKPAPVPTRAPAAAPAPASGRIEPSFGLPVDEELVAQPLPDHDLEPAPMAASGVASGTNAARTSDAPPLPMREAAASVINAHAPTAPSAPPVARTPAVRRAEKAAARRSRLTPTRIDAPPKIRVPESDEPEFVRRSRQQEQSGRTRKIAMLAGSIVLFLILVAQGAITFRNALAARFPAAKPALVSSCAVLGCRVELPAQIENLVIETGELTTLGGGAYAFTTQLRNQGAVAQAWPSLELSLTDANDKPLVRRVFAPRDYLAANAAAAATGLAPRTEQAIKLHFRVDDLQPSGYHIAVFYP